MASNVNAFIQNRSDALSITHRRIRFVLSYFIECYCILLNDGVSYSISETRSRTTLAFEDFLKFEFIEKYLNSNKHLIKAKMSELEEITFTAETQERYIDTDGLQKPDKIDIYINNLGLQKVWKNDQLNIYFALECKRIKSLFDIREYIADIEKFCNRNHTNLRLPFEGQLAFIETSKFTITDIVTDINTKLHTSDSITTNSYLSKIKLHSTLDCTFSSEHQKNFGNKPSFLIYHLLLDYSGIVVA